jgi:hypothetical protein
MKKLLLIGIGFVLAIAVFGVAGFALAQTQEPPETETAEGPEFPYGRGGWSRGSHGGMMGGPMGFAPGGMMDFGLDEGETGLLHDYLWPAVAEAFGLTEEQIEAFEIVRDTIQGIREDLTQEEIFEAMKQAKTTAIENALADGAITEEQAEQWLERLEQMEGFAPGKAGDFRRGFSRGVQVGRQMMINHEYMEAAIAEALDISVEEFQELRTEEGFNLKTYADEQGLTDEEFNALHIEILTNAVNAALEDGAITQEQADGILERLENAEGRGVWFGRP